MNEDRIQHLLSRLGQARLDQDTSGRIFGAIRRRLTVRETSPRWRACDFMPALCMLRRFSCVGIILVAIIIAAGGGTIAAAQVAMPGHPFYGLKLVSERVFEQLTPGGEARLNLYNDLVARRAQELASLKVQALIPRDGQTALLRQGVKKTAARLTQNIANLRQDVNKISASPAAKKSFPTLQTLNTRVEVLETVLNDLQDTVPQDSQAAQTVTQAQQAVEDLQVTVKTIVAPSSRAEAGAALEEAQAVLAEIRRAEDHLSSMGISSTVGITEDLRTMSAMLKDTDSFLAREQYSEAYMLAKTATRMGDKILRALGDRLINRVK
ncbi:hypothetical protein HYW17_04730 [Candidatus Uhrbacteria bacterium]|nr:hypothetical protein [Candidatus Uhrbacteria bacterium]